MRLLPPLAGLATGALLLVGLSSCGDEGTLTPVALTDTGATAQAWWDALYKQQKDRIPQDKVVNPGEPWGQFVGSRQCGTCHGEEYAKWKKSFHSRTLYDAVPGTVIGDFQRQTIDVPAIFDWDSGKREHFTRAPYLAEVFTEADAQGRVRYFMEIWENPDWPKGTPRDVYALGDPTYQLPKFVGRMRQEIAWTFGNRRHQPYVSRWNSAPGDEVNEGAFWTLPFFYNDAEKRWEFCGFRRYTESCASCHTTGIKTSPVPTRGENQGAFYTSKIGNRHYNLPPGEEGWAEGAVGCENCHGPGLEHVRQVNAVGVEAYRALRRSGKKPPSIFPSTRASETLHRLTNQCDSCHNFFTETSITFVPGPHGYGRDARHDRLDPAKDPHHMQHFPDGSKKSPCSIGEVYRQSKMWKAGIACFDCHDPHGSDHFGSLKKPIHDNSLCIDCHVTLAEPAAQLAHSKHEAGSPGNRCVECHMPRHMVFTNGQKHMSDRLHNHILDVPKGGRRPDEPPTSCNLCHTDRDEAWTAAEIKRLWPPGTKDASQGDVLRETPPR